MVSPAEDMDELISHTAHLCCDEVSLDLLPNSDLAGMANNLALVGKIIADRLVNIHAFRIVITKAWSVKDGLSISALAPNTFLFEFPNVFDRKRALNTGPWSVLGFHLVLKEWPPSLVLDEIEFSLSSFWVQIHGLPSDRMTQANAMKVGAFIGRLISTDVPVSWAFVWNKFLRIKVEFNNM
ncbi:hypothetical protein L1049_019387 [Liquidambar formosana]|uniref:DUF4283 domain-containing protein n=1 Tax=Liquidambar formosana TaxID=63359 RepID=A0AAP0SCI6_LIQFO